MTDRVRYTSNGQVQIAYESFGDLAHGEPLLLIMGLDFQMVWWPEGLCEQLVEAGFAVVRFDNRDAGLSTHFDSPRRQSPWRALMGGTKPAYTSADMVDDALAVMDAVGWDSAHVMGGSLGAALAHTTALLHPQRVRSLVSCMGLPVTASPLKTLTYLRFGVYRKLLTLPRATDRDGQIRNLVEAYRAVASPGYPFPEQWARQAATTSYDRRPRDPRSTQRQLAAGRAVTLPPLSTITAPTLVVSGADDPMGKPSGGRDTAQQIPGATFVVYPGVGHNLPEELWPDVVARIRANADRFARRSSGAP